MADTYTIPDPNPGESWQDYAQRAVSATVPVVDPSFNPPQPHPGESWRDYGQRVAAAAADDSLSEPTFESAIGGRVPKVDKAPSNTDEATELGKMFAEYRAEVAALRRELAAHRPRPVAQVGMPTESPQDRLNARLEAIGNHSHYCPGCGALGKYAQKCGGHPERPHAPIEMVETEELGGDPDRHTHAPSTDPDQPDLIAA